VAGHTQELILGVVALVLAVVARGATVNRLIHGKLRLSLFAFVVYLAATLLLMLGQFAPGAELAERIRGLGDLLFALGLVNLVVILAINPWRTDRVPHRFPNIVQDAIIIAVFAVVATALMKEKFLTTSAVGAVVIGFALQDTLGNMFAGLALQVERPFSVGHWIKVASFEGRVTGITWRATQLRTKNGDSVVVPNNIISKEAIVNYSSPEGPTRLVVEVGASYDASPNRVKAVIAEAVSDASLVLKTPPPEVVIADFGASSINYRIKFWVADYGPDDAARDQVRSCVYYAFRRVGIEIPYPIQVEYRGEQTPSVMSAAERLSSLEAVDLFNLLPEQERQALAGLAAERLFGAGETVVRQGQPGDSMFVVCQGSVRVLVGENRAEVATTGAGGYFGEMSLLTGDPRSATVAAIGDCVLLEITASDFRRIALAHPDVLVAVSQAVEARRSGLEQTKRSAAAAPAVEDAPKTFLARVQQFLRLPTSRT
jgi:small-conductance mechanosensitive channel/CRP-like cAMP-binding protein